MKLSLRLILFSSLTILLVICIAYVSILDSRVINKLEGVLWTVPAKVYARPLELAEGGNINLGQLKKRFKNNKSWLRYLSSLNWLQLNLKR